jgi:hypothetical protein
VALHEAKDRRAGLGEPSLVARPAHRLADACRGQLRDHTCRFGGRERRPVREDPAVDHQQLLARARLTAEHDPAEAHAGVDREDDLGQLGLTDSPIKGVFQLRQPRILVFCGEARQV